jgi:ribosome-binding factor A
MKSRRLEKINSLMRQLAAAYLAKETNGSLLTVTRVETANDLKNAKIFVSIFPESKEKEIFEDLKKKTDDLRNYIGSQIKMKFLPRLEFETDKAEKSRQKIEEILKNKDGLVAPEADASHRYGAGK